MKASCCRLLAWTLALLAVGLCAPGAKAGGQETAPSPPGWKRHDLKNTTGDVISVVLPREPEKFPGGQLKTAGGDALAVNLFLVAAGAKLYFVVFVDGLPTPAEQMTERQRGELFHDCWVAVAEHVRRALRARHDTPLLIAAFDQRAKKLDGREGREQRFYVGANEGRAQMILAERSAYMLVGVWPESSPADEHTAFFQSFAVRRAPAGNV